MPYALRNPHANSSNPLPLGRQRMMAAVARNAPRDPRERMRGVAERSKSGRRGLRWLLGRKRVAGLEGFACQFDVTARYVTRMRQFLELSQAKL